ncbi:hypothetical protein MTR67_040516, partial [Solanum verrucosum]
AGLQREKDKASIGMAVIDSYGHLLHAFGTPIQFVGKAITAEALAILEAVERALQSGWSKIRCFYNFELTNNNYGMQDDTNMDEDKPLDLITKNVYELQKIIKYKKQKLQKDKPRRKDKVNADHKQEPTRERETEKQQKEKERE